MTTAAADQAVRTRLRVAFVALSIPVALYLLLHYVVVTWLTVELISRLDVLSTRMFTIAGADVRLWWLISALVIVLGIAAHLFSMAEEFGITLSFVTHVPAIVSAWVLVWTGFPEPGQGIGAFIGNLFWTVVFAGLIAGSCLAIAAGAHSLGAHLDKRVEEHLAVTTGSGQQQEV